MIRWCSYCQSYQGESEPFDDYSMTHMICDHCDSRNVIVDELALLKQRAIAAYYGELRSLVRDCRIDDAALLLEQAPRLGILPSDLVVGLIQPLIHWLAGLWVHTPSSVESERHFILQIVVLLEQLVHRYPELEHYRNVENPRVLLIAATNDVNCVGTRMVELALASRGVSSKVVLPDYDPAAVLACLRRHEPKMVGLGVASEAQLLKVHQLVEALRASSLVPTLEFLIGGIPIRLGCRLDARLGVHHCRSVMDILHHVDLESSRTLLASGPFPCPETSRALASAKLANAASGETQDALG